MKKVETCEQEVRGIGIVAVVAIAILISFTQTGCMQLTGAKLIELWGARFEANSGFDVSAGVMQYDYAMDKKGINIEHNEGRNNGKY